MGGFVVNISELHNTLTMLTLTPTGILALADRGHFLAVSSDMINDKSKADLLAKGLIMCQVTWLVVQCIARASVDLPLTLLEVHTCVHVVCAVMMYTLWWHKPKDVQDPTKLDGVAIGAPLAWLLLHDKTVGHEYREIAVKNSPDRLLPSLLNEAQSLHFIPAPSSEEFQKVAQEVSEEMFYHLSVPEG